MGKTARPFRYDLNQIPYDYTVEVTNRFKGPDLIDRVTEVCDTAQETGIKTIPKGESNGTPLQYCCLENPWTEEPGGLQSMGWLRVRHD